jgi:hypothetical protein
MEDILNSTRRLLAALDLSKQNDTVLSLQRQHGEVSDALARADDRITEIRSELAKKKGPDARAVADALLDGAEATAAARVGQSEEELREQIDALRAGMGELRRREEDLREQIRLARVEASEQAIIATEPLAQALTAEMRATATRLIEQWAAFTALAEALGGHMASSIAARDAVKGLCGSDRLLPHQRTIPVPREIQDLIGLLRDKGPSLQVRAPVALPLPY